MFKEKNIMATKDYGEFVKSMTIIEQLDWIDYHFMKYRKMGYDVGSFRSYSSVSDENNKLITGNKFSYHEFKTIDEMEEYLKNKKE